MKTRNQLKAIIAYAMTYDKSVVLSVHTTYESARQAMEQTRTIIEDTDADYAVQISQRTILLGNGSKIMFTNDEKSFRGVADVDMMELNGVAYGADLRAARAADGMVLL